MLPPLPECPFPTPQAAGNGSAAAAGSCLPYVMHARRKGETAWSIIAQLQHLDDAKAALWAVVFTSQYAEIKVRESSIEAPVAEWPAGLAPLASTQLRAR